MLATFCLVSAVPRPVARTVLPAPTANDDDGGIAPCGAAIGGLGFGLAGTAAAGATALLPTHRALTRVSSNPPPPRHHNDTAAAIDGGLWEESNGRGRGV
jgi:hypothetical protein